MSKRLGSLYRSGRVDHWLKVKNPARRRCDVKRRRTGAASAMAGDTATPMLDAKATDDDLIERVRRRVEEAQRAITQQKGRVARLRDKGR